MIPLHVNHASHQPGDYEAALAHEREKWQTAEKQVNDMQHKLKESSEENLRLQTALQEHTSNKAVSQGVNWQYQDYKVEGSWYAFPQMQTISCIMLIWLFGESRPNIDLQPSIRVA